MKEFTHFDEKGNAVMIDVGDKAVTERTAVATGRIHLSKACYDLVQAGSMKKGDVLGVARIAGIMGTKRTPDLIPLCHPIMLTKSSIDFETDDEAHTITVCCTVKTSGVTGVEMEALTGVQIALLTIYDMCKAVDKNMLMTDIHLCTKTGGKSGNFTYTGQTK